MTTFSYSQLEGLWIQAGGPKSLAPIAAAIAEAESSGNSNAQNASGATGLWQILGNPFPGNAFDPQTNAKMAVAKWRQAPGGGDNFTPWVTYTSGAYKQFLRGGVPPSGGGGKGGKGGSGGSGTPGSGSTGASPAQLDAFLTSTSPSGGVLQDAGALLHGTAVVLDRAFGLFAPGQGWRIVFGAAAILLFFASYKAFGGSVTL